MRLGECEPQADLAVREGLDLQSKQLQLRARLPEVRKPIVEVLAQPRVFQTRQRAIEAVSALLDSMNTGGIERRAEDQATTANSRDLVQERLALRRRDVLEDVDGDDEVEATDPRRASRWHRP